MLIGRGADENRKVLSQHYFFDFCAWFSSEKFYDRAQPLSRSAGEFAALENADAADEPHGRRIERTDIRSQTGIREKDRQKKHRHEIAHSPRNRFTEFALRGKDRAEKERAEDGEDANQIRRNGGQQHADQEQ